MGQPGGEYVHLSVIGGREDGWTERIEGSRIGSRRGSRIGRAAATRQPPRQVCSVPLRPFSTYLVRPAGSGKRSRTAVPMAVADNCAQRVDEELCNTGIECWCAIPPVVTLLVSINTHEDMRPALSIALHC